VLEKINGTLSDAWTFVDAASPPSSGELGPIQGAKRGTSEGDSQVR
jgi:hypothetical protein